MAIKSQTCFVLCCDLCNGMDADADFIPHFDNPEDARESGTYFDNGWTHWLGKDWCPSCNPACLCGDFFGDHEYGEDRCEECACGGFQLPESALKESTS